MKIAVLYNIVERATDDVPLPDNWNEILKRFRDAYVAHEPGMSHDLFLCASGAPLSERSRGLFAELPYRELCYLGKGWDIGAYQHCASRLRDYDFVMFMNSQTFVTINGWLRHFVDAYAAHGPGIYGASSSFEVSPHIRTAAFGAPPRLLLEYPVKVRTRYDACVFEHSPVNFSQWALGRRLAVEVVMRSGVSPLGQSRQGANVFRRGNQEDLIVRDRHALVYDAASPIERERLECAADGKIPVDFVYQGMFRRLIDSTPVLRKAWRVLSDLKHGRLMNGRGWR